VASVVSTYPDDLHEAGIQRRIGLQISQRYFIRCNILVSLLHGQGIQATTVVNFIGWFLAHHGNEPPGCQLCLVGASLHGNSFYRTPLFVSHNPE